MNLRPALVSLALAALSAQELVVGSRLTVVGAHALDGDSLRVRFQEREIDLRLWGIDAPEHGQPGAEEARHAVAALTKGRTLTVEVVDLDRFQRPIVRLQAGAVEINQRLVEAGWAWWFRRFAPDAATYRDAEAQARAARRGVWQAADPEPPWVFRDRQPAAP